MAIAKVSIEGLRFEWTVFDEFKQRLRDILRVDKLPPRAGWLAYKLENGIYYFKWTDGKERIPRHYMDKLRKDGWKLTITGDAIEEAFTRTKT